MSAADDASTDTLQLDLPDGHRDPTASATLKSEYERWLVERLSPLDYLPERAFRKR